MKVKYQFISNPDSNTVRLVQGRMRPAERKRMEEGQMPDFGAFLLIQGTIPEMVQAADISVKASDVVSFELVGNCPQSFITIVIAGKIRSVQTALKAVLAAQDNRTDDILGSFV